MFGLYVASGANASVCQPGFPTLRSVRVSIDGYSVPRRVTPQGEYDIEIGSATWIPMWICCLTVTRTNAYTLDYFVVRRATGVYSNHSIAALLFERHDSGGRRTSGYASQERSSLQFSKGMVGSRGEWRATHHSKSSSTTTGSGLGPIDDLSWIQGEMERGPEPTNRYTVGNKNRCDIPL